MKSVNKIAASDSKATVLGTKFEVAFFDFQKVKNWTNF